MKGANHLTSDEIRAMKDDLERCDERERDRFLASAGRDLLYTALNLYEGNATLCAAASSLTLQRDTVRRRVRAVLRDLGVADCDDPIDALEALAEDLPRREREACEEHNAGVMKRAAAEQEIERLKGALDGSLKAPTDEEIYAHAAKGGRWLVGRVGGEVHLLDCKWLARVYRDDAAERGIPLRWQCLSQDGRVLPRE